MRRIRFFVIKSRVYVKCVFNDVFIFILGDEYFIFMDCVYFL